MASVLAQKIVESLTPSDGWVSRQTAERIVVVVLCEMEAMGWVWPGEAKLTAEQEKMRALHEIIGDLKQACEYSRVAAAAWREIAQSKRGEAAQGVASSPNISVPVGWKLVRDER
jgi:hypothetical protein